MPDGLKRLHNSGQAHCLTFSCFHRRPFLAQMRMEDAFLESLELARQRFEMRVYGYIVMPEHVHLLVSEPAPNVLSSFMQVLKTKVSIQASKQRAKSAQAFHFWQERYFDHNVRNHEGFVTQLRYIHRNPVKRGLCAAPQDWKWSSFRAWSIGEDGWSMSNRSCGPQGGKQSGRAYELSRKTRTPKCGPAVLLSRPRAESCARTGHGGSGERLEQPEFPAARARHDKINTTDDRNLPSNCEPVLSPHARV